MGVGGQYHAPAALPPGKTWYPLYKLKSTVNFPMRIFNGSSTVTEEIFIDLLRNFTTHTLINGLSDHHTPLLKLEKVIAPI